MALIRTEIFLGRWDQKFCELLHNTHFKKGVIMLGKNTLCIRYGLLYAKY